jgi:hypothetical protein
MEVLSVAFPGRWIGRDGSVLQPPRSPDLTPAAVRGGFVNSYIYMDEI